MIINPYFYPSGPTDPDFASVISLLHLNGADTSTTFTDVIGKTWTAAGSAQIDTAQSVFGGASGLFVSASSDTVSTPHHADWAFGSGAFALEMRVRFSTVAAGLGTVLMKVSAGLYAPWFILRNGTDLSLYSSSDGANWDIASAMSFGTVAANTWYAIAVTRSGTSIRTFLDGTVANTVTSSATLWNDVTAPVHLGARGGDLYFDGHIDEFRATKGVARYTGNYTVETAAFPDF